MNNVNPYLWLKDVLEKLNDHPVNKLADLLPHNWVKNQGTINPPLLAENKMSKNFF
jgi:hypothetical protein